MASLLATLHRPENSAILTSAAECVATKQTQESPNPLVVVQGLEHSAVPGLDEHTGHATSKETLLRGEPETELKPPENSVMRTTDSAEEPFVPAHAPGDSVEASSKETLLQGAAMQTKKSAATSPSLLEATAKMGEVRITTCAYGHAYTIT